MAYYGDIFKMVGAAQAANPEAIARRGLQGAEQQGFFDPRGSEVMRARVRRQALRNARNRLGRGRTLAGITGVDPQQARIAQLGFEQSAGDDISGALQGADLEQETANRDWFRNLFTSQLDRASAERVAREQAKAAKAQGYGSAIGQLGGAAIGKFF